MEQGPQQDLGVTAERDVFVKMAILVCTLASGGAIMVYEFLAIRFLQRDFGGTVDVWASEIAVCLAGLAVGYAVGGRLADRYRSLRLMSAGLFLGGLLGLFIERLALLAGNVLLDIDFGLAWHPLLAAGLSTFLPILALGTVFPQAVRLQAVRLEEVGSSTGLVAALSTTGSIAGVLLTAMVLLERWGAREILFGSSAILMILAVLTGSVGRKGVAATMLALSLGPAPAHAQVMFETYSAYHHILVRDVGNTRILLFDDARQSLMSLGNPYEGGFEYTDFFHVPIVLDPTIDRVLFVGLGGATGPKSFYRNYPGMRIDVAEIDPVVAEVAARYFSLPKNPRLKIHIADGRVFLRRARGTYGAIIMDAYGTGRYGPYLPYHLATREFFTIAKKRLRNGGCVVYNVMGAHGGLNDDVVRHLLTTLESLFQVVYVFQARTSINTVFIAMKIDTESLHEDGTRDGLSWPQGPWLQHPLAAGPLRELAHDLGRAFLSGIPGFEQRLTQYSPAYFAPRTGVILTDNYAPVDLAPARR